MAKKKVPESLVARATSMVFNAVTNKKTTLIRLGGESAPLDKGHGLVVYDEDGPFGNVGTEVNGQWMSGSVFRSDYNRV